LFHLNKSPVLLLTVNVDYHSPLLENSKCSINEATWVSSTINNAISQRHRRHFLSTTALFGRPTVFSYREIRMNSSIDETTEATSPSSPPFHAPCVAPQDRRHKPAALSADAFGNASVARRIALINRLSISLAITEQLFLIPD